MYEATVREDVLRVASPGGRWLQAGIGGGYRSADAAVNVTVPTGFDRTDLEAYVDERLEAAGLEADGPALLTGVSMADARGARVGDVVAYATVGLSNPAALPIVGETVAGEDLDGATGEPDRVDAAADREPPRHDGTVNLLVGTTRALDDGALVQLLATVVEAKAATLSALAGVPGTTSDGVAVAGDPAGEPASFAGSATAVGDAARACVREAVRAALAARYPEGDHPTAPADVEHGVATTRRAAVFEPTAGE